MIEVLIKSNYILFIYLENIIPIELR